MIKSAAKESAEQKAYRLIVDLIKRKYKPGDFLLEGELAEKFAMSRTPVASALRTLISQGVLQKLPKKGCFIPNINKEDAQNLFLARKTLEAAAVAVSSEVAQEDDISVAQGLLEKAERANRENQFLEFTYLDEEFHHHIVRISRNKYLYDAWCPIYFRCNLYTRFFDKFYTQKTNLKENTLIEHGDILKAIARHETDKVRRLICEHIDSALRFVID